MFTINGNGNGGAELPGIKPWTVRIISFMGAGTILALIIFIFTLIFNAGNNLGTLKTEVKVLNEQVCILRNDMKDIRRKISNLNNFLLEKNIKTNLGEGNVKSEQIEKRRNIVAIQ